MISKILVSTIQRKIEKKKKNAKTINLSQFNIWIHLEW